MVKSRVKSNEASDLLRESFPVSPKRLQEPQSYKEEHIDHHVCIEQKTNNVKEGNATAAVNNQLI